MDAVIVLEREDLDPLLAALAGEGYTVIGPTVREGAIVYDEVRESGDLPVGWTDEQDGGHYRLRRRDDEALFGYAVGPTRWKRYQLPPELTLWRARRGADGALPRSRSRARRRRATRSSASARASCTRSPSRTGSCSGARTSIRLRGPSPATSFVVAVNCGQAGGTCFCVLDGHRARARAAATTSP